MRVAFDPAARSELDRVFEWIAKDNPRAASEMIARIEAKVMRLGTPGLANMGRLGLVKGTRELLEYPYIIVYKCTRNEMRLWSYRSCTGRRTGSTAGRDRSENYRRYRIAGFSGGFPTPPCLATIALLIGSVFAPALGHAQEALSSFPSRTVKLVVPAAGGSTTDTLARIMADQLARRWGKPVIVENISGGMVLGAAQVFRMAPDGYTLMVSPPAQVTFIHLLYRDLAFDPLRFVPVALLAKVANALVARNDLPAGSVSELIAYARANPGTMTYGSQGAGSTAHLSASQLEGLGSIKMVHVPYRGAVPALNDVIAGHIDMFFDTLTTAAPMYRAGKVKILAVGGAERSPVVAEVPTLAESGLPGFRSVTWFAIVAPPATPAALADKINRDVVEGLRQPDVAASLARLTLEPMIGSPADATRFFAEETRLWGRVIAEAHIKIE